MTKKRRKTLAIESNHGRLHFLAGRGKVPRSNREFEVKGLVRVIVLTAIFLAAVSIPDASGQETVPIANVEIRMVKSSTRGPLRVTAETRNPNDFAVRDVQMNCTIKSEAGKDLVSYRSTILSVFEANERKTTRNLSVGAWPPDGFAALCVSTGAKRVQRSTQTQ